MGRFGAPYNAMNRKYLYLSVALLISVGVAIFYTTNDPEKAEETATNGYNIAEWTLSKRCSDSTEIYQLPDGDYAIWRGENENDQHWVKLTPGVSPDQYCN